MSHGDLPLSRPVPVSSVPEEGRRIVVEASAEERAALARADGLVDIQRLIGTFDVTPQRRGQSFRVTGDIAAKVVETCSVTLEPFEMELQEPVDLVFMPTEAMDAWERRHPRNPGKEAGLETEDPPDLIENGKIDLGRVAAEFLSLARDPYPKKPGAVFEPERNENDKVASPFAALVRLKDRE